MNDIMDRKIYSLEFDVVFPAGLAPGAGSFGNRIQLAKNGRGDYVLHGTAIAGVLRHAIYKLKLYNTSYDKEFAKKYIEKFFGAALDNNPDSFGTSSPLKVDDIIIMSSESNDFKQPIERISHLRCRHTGAVADGCLYSMESIPPGAKAKFHLLLMEPNDFNDDEALTFLKEIAGLFQTGLIFGGNGNRGVGLAKVNPKKEGDFLYKSYDLTCLEGYAQWLDDDYKRRNNSEIEGLKKLDFDPSDNGTLKVTWNFVIPSGQDILVSDGKGLDAESEPHRVIGSDGHDYWLLPGSSLRGLFRNECSRLAAKEGKTIADSVENYQKYGANGDNYGDQVGWMFQEDQKDNPYFWGEIDRDYPVESMFGSLHKAGRLHISDALSPIGIDDRPMRELAVNDHYPVQYRVHVAIDPISGGAIEGALFDNYVLTSGGGKNQIRFPVTMILQNPKEDEVRWLAQTLKNIHTGLLRVGSSKSAGRLEVENDSLKTEGEFSELFDGIDINPDGNWTYVPPPETGKVPSNVPKKEEAPITVKEVPSIQGTLLLPAKKNSPYRVQYTNLKGKKIDMVVPLKAIFFDQKDASNGMAVNIILDKGLVCEVTIPGKPVVSPSVNPAATKQSLSNRSNKPVSTNILPKASSSILKMPFHNPYTFIPFSKVAPERAQPTYQTADEIEKSRFSGILEIELRTVTPLLISEGWPRQKKENLQVDVSNIAHKIYDIQRIGNDVIVPATGVRGFFRNLVTIVKGAPLIRRDGETWLCQGRDLQLTSSNLKSSKIPAILARVIKPGNSLKSGIIEIGETKLIRADVLEKKYGDTLPRPDAKGDITHLWTKYKGDDDITNIVEVKDADHPSEIKLSGKPVKEENKHEGVFISPIRRITLSARFWNAYNNRHKHGVRPELKEGDLVWIESSQKGVRPENIKEEKDIVSLQWARWGRKGIQLETAVEKWMNPASYPEDGLVSMVTDLFGQVPVQKGSKKKIFKGRIITGNLVFKDGFRHIQKEVPLAVMATPHLGCIPFYRNNNDSNAISNDNKLCGYKVYRRQAPGEKEPWLFETQGVYDQHGYLEDSQQKVNISADLLEPGQSGTVTVSLRSLSESEMALILYLCQDIWRLGGGKPLGLGACEVVGIRLWDDKGKLVDPGRFPMQDNMVIKRFGCWKKTQKPVAKVRYPRAVIRNENSNKRGGMSWFQKMSVMKKGSITTGA